MLREAVEEVARRVIEGLRKELWSPRVEVFDIIMLDIAREFLDRKRRNLITCNFREALERFSKFSRIPARSLLRVAVRLSKELGLCFNGNPLEIHLIRALIAWSREIESWLG